MRDILSKKIDLYNYSNGKHLCCTCIHANEVDSVAGFLMTTQDYNSCDYISERYEGENDPIEQEDNGSGYWITKCKYYKFDRNWDRVNYYDYMKSDEWKAKRLECLKRDNFQCQKCGTAKNLVIHHWTYDRLGNEDLGDIVTLCKDCHKKIHENDLSGRE